MVLIIYFIMFVSCLLLVEEAWVCGAWAAVGDSQPMAVRAGHGDVGPKRLFCERLTSLIVVDRTK